MSSKIFRLIALTAIIEQTKAPKNFLYNLLVGEEKPEKVQDLEVHTKEAGRKRAPLVGRRQQGVFIEKDSFAVQRVKPAWIKLQAVNEAEAVFEQQFGQTPYADPQGVGKQMLADTMKNFKDIAFRTRQWMLIETLKTGVCPMESGVEGVKYGDINTEVLTGNDLFSNPNCNPIDYLEKKQTEIQKQTGVVIDTVIFSPDVAGAFLKNEKVKEYLNTRHANYVRVNDSKAETDDGRKEIAYLPTLGITIFSFVDWYEDMETGNEEQVVPPKTCIGVKAKSFAFKYAAMSIRTEQGKPAQLLVKKEAIRKWYPDYSEDEELQYFSRPLCMPREDVKSWFIATVL